MEEDSSTQVVQETEEGPAEDDIMIEENDDQEGGDIIIEEDDDSIIVEEDDEEKQSEVSVGGDGTEESAPEETEEQIEIAVMLNHSYTTRFGEVNMITYPSFMFQYPDNWSITEENVTAQGETVVLTNERGVTVTFSHICGVPEGQLSASTGPELFRAELSEASESAFVPGYVQATDYSDLGTFMVAKVTYTGSSDAATDAERKEADGKTLYAVLPESRIGTDENVGATAESAFSFWYAGYISFIAESPDGTFTPQEEQEVLSILETFMVNG